MTFLSALLRVIVAAIVASGVLMPPATAVADGCHSQPSRGVAVHSSAHALSPGQAVAHFDRHDVMRGLGGCAPPAHSSHGSCDAIGCCSAAVLVNVILLPAATTTALRSAPGHDSLATGTRPAPPQEPPRVIG